MTGLLVDVSGSDFLFLQVPSCTASNLQSMLDWAMVGWCFSDFVLAFLEFLLGDAVGSEEFCGCEKDDVNVSITVCIFIK